MKRVGKQCVNVIDFFLYLIFGIKHVGVLLIRSYGV